MICNRCGLPVNNGAWNCPRCGNKLGQENSNNALPPRGNQAVNSSPPPPSALPLPSPVGVPSTAIESFGAEVSETRNAFQGANNRMAAQPGTQTTAPMRNGAEESAGLNGYINASLAPRPQSAAYNSAGMNPYGASAQTQFGQSPASYPQQQGMAQSFQNPYSQQQSFQNPYGQQQGMMQTAQTSYPQQWNGYGQPGYYPQQSGMNAYGQQPGGYGQPGMTPYGQPGANQSPYQGQGGWAPSNPAYGQPPFSRGMSPQTPTPRTIPGDTGRIFLSMQEMQEAKNQNGTPAPEKKNGWVGWLIALIVILVIAFVLLLVYYLKADMPFTLENLQNYYVNLFRSIIDGFKA